jgi:hypothetical protein
MEFSFGVAFILGIVLGIVASQRKWKITEWF